MRQHGGEGGAASQQEALEAEKKADKNTAKLEKKQQEDAGKELPWQARARMRRRRPRSRTWPRLSYGIVGKHPEPEDVLYAMLVAHRNDGSKSFQSALAGFAQMWLRQEKVSA